LQKEVHYMEMLAADEEATNFQLEHKLLLVKHLTESLANYNLLLPKLKVGLAIEDMILFNCFFVTSNIYYFYL